jgi:hypothetical protein
MLNPYTQIMNISLLSFTNFYSYSRDMSLIPWIKTHKLLIVLFLIIVYLVFGNTLSYTSLSSQSPMLGNTNYSKMSLPSVGGIDSYPQSFSRSEQDLTTTNRMVIQESNLSLLVKNVRETGNAIVSYAEKNEGYMVTSSYNRPEESPFATITVRVPTTKFKAALSYFNSLAVKVTNENLLGTDVTEQYTDIEAQLSTLRATKVKFDDILNKATQVQDILTVQREIITLQAQIDNLIGQQKALSQNAELTRITVYLSTDELALPYAPDQVFRPDVVFKHAARSLLTTFRVIAEMLIWVGVYSVIWVPVTGAYIYYKRRKKTTNLKN